LRAIAARLSKTVCPVKVKLALLRDPSVAKGRRERRLERANVEQGFADITDNHAGQRSSLWRSCSAPVASK
jgi:hypothetical protein